MDQSSFAAPHGLSQRITSFIACACQGIHQLPLRHLIVLIVYAHHLLDLEFLSFSLALEGVPNLTIRTSRICQTQRPDYLLQSDQIMMPSTCSTDLLYWSHAERPTCSLSLRPASRDQIRYRAVRRRQSDHLPEAVRRPQTANDPERQASFLPPIPHQSPAG